MTATDLAERLDARRSGTGWSARCPAHDDRAPSLSITEGDDGRVLLHCHAGCTPEAVCRAVGVSLRDLMPTDERPGRNGSGQLRMAKTYAYTDENGDLLFEVCRYEPKTFRQRRPDGKGGHVWDLEGVRRVLYRFPEVLSTVKGRRAVFIVEGEKDADALARIGLCGTTCPQGAGKWRPEYSECLLAAHVVIVPDNDGPGRRHADDVARALHGIAKSVRVLALPDLPPKGDVSDWLAKGGTKAALLRLAKGAPVFDPRATPPEPPAGSRLELLDVATWADLTGKPPEWLLDGAIPLGALTLLVSRPKCGKSTLARALIQAVTRGADFLGRTVRQGSVLYLPCEERPHDVADHLRRLGCDLTRVTIPLESRTEEYTRPDGTKVTDTRREIVTDPARLEGVIAELQPVLIVVDTLGMAVQFKDLRAYEIVTEQMKPWLRLAAVHDCAVVGLHHQGKGEAASIGTRALGSTALAALAHSILSITADANGTRYLEAEGRNLRPFEKTILDYDLDDGTVRTGGTQAERTRREMSEAVLEAARTFGGTFTKQDLLANVEGRAVEARRAFDAAVNGGTLIRAGGTGRKGDPFRYRLEADEMLCPLCPDTIRDTPDIAFSRSEQPPSAPSVATGPDMESDPFADTPDIADTPDTPDMADAPTPEWEPM